MIPSSLLRVGARFSLGFDVFNIARFFPILLPCIGIVEWHIWYKGTNLNAFCFWAVRRAGLSRSVIFSLPFTPSALPFFLLRLLLFLCCLFSVLLFSFLVFLYCTVLLSLSFFLKKDFLFSVFFSVWCLGFWLFGLLRWRSEKFSLGYGCHSWAIFYCEVLNVLSVSLNLLLLFSISLYKIITLTLLYCISFLFFLFYFPKNQGPWVRFNDLET